MGEQKRRKQYVSLGPTKLEPRVDIDLAIEELERLVEADKVQGFIQIVKLRDVAPGIFPIKLVTLGLEKDDAYAMLCQMKLAMEQTMGYRDGSAGDGSNGSE